MTLHEDLTRAIEDARDHSRKNFNVVKESYGQYLARAILASDVIAQVRAETLREFAGVVREIAALGPQNSGLRTPDHLAEYAANYADRIEKEAGL